jgi:hypothetical protein
MSILELLFSWWIVTSLGIGAIIVAEPLWRSRGPKDGGSIELDSDSDREVGRAVAGGVTKSSGRSRSRRN